MSIDLETVAGIAACSWMLVAALGRLSAWIRGHQELTALGFAIVLWAGVRTGPGIDWVQFWADLPQAVVEIVLAVLAAGVAHDKIVKPAVRLIDEAANGGTND